jgi:hypothetical protein
MPRKGKGTSFNNRTDLAMPVTTVPGQEYGRQIAQAQAQKIVPMGPTATPAPAPMPAPGPASAMPQQAPAQQPTAFAGGLNWHGPTERPNEPIQAGLPSGPGPGPEVLGIGAPPAIAQTLQSLSTQGRTNSVLSSLADAAKILGI